MVKNYSRLGKNFADNTQKINCDLDKVLLRPGQKCSHGMFKKLLASWSKSRLGQKVIREKSKKIRSNEDKMFHSRCGKKNRGRLS